MTKVSIIVAVAAAALFTAGAAVAKPGTTGSGVTPGVSSNGLGKPGGWTSTPPGLGQDKPDIPNFRKGWGDGASTPPGWSGKTWDGGPPGFGNRPAAPSTTTVK
jgi:hypothetical protein